MADALSIAHQGVTITVNERHGFDTTAIENIPVYLFTAGGAYLGQSAKTDASGKVMFNLPPANYQVRADYLSSQTWSEVFNQADVSVEIAHWPVDSACVCRRVGSVRCSRVPVYSGRRLSGPGGTHGFCWDDGVYSPGGQFTSSERITTGSQVWSEVVNILADEQTVTDMDLDLQLSDLTLNPNTVRFDGTPPKYCA